jgi:mono/diheme cytochrome c family protein
MISSCLLRNHLAAPADSGILSEEPQKRLDQSTEKRNCAVRLTILPLLLAIPLGLAPLAFALPDDEALARRLLNTQGCKACHQIEGGVATLGPNLEKVGSRLTREQLRSQLVNQQKRHAGGRIADFSHLQENEVAALITFLEQRK